MTTKILSNVKILHKNKICICLIGHANMVSKQPNSSIPQGFSAQEQRGQSQKKEF